MHCFVTGASGRLGSALVNELLARHYFVTALVMNRNETEKLPKGVEVIVGDLNDKAAIDKGVSQNQTVFHLAALVNYEVGWEPLERVNVQGTRNVADACAKYGAKLIYVSTTGVYGKKLAEIPANEKTPTYPTDLYGRSKLEAERIIGERHGTFPYIIFRISVMYGPPYFDIYSRVLKKIENGSMQVLGKGDNVIPFVHSSDVIEALIAGARSEIKAGTFVISENITLTQTEIYQFAGQLLGTEFKPRHTDPGFAKALINITSIVKKSSITAEDINVLSSHRIFDTTRAQQLLAWKPKIMLIDGIKQMVAMYKERKEKIARIREIRHLRELKAQGKLPPQNTPTAQPQTQQTGQTQQQPAKQQTTQPPVQKPVQQQPKPQQPAQQPAQKQEENKDEKWNLDDLI